MNGLARITAALGGTRTDRVPVSPLLALYGARLTDCALRSYYSDSKLYAAGQEAVFSLFGPDILFGPFALTLEGAAFGSEVRYFPDQAPNLGRPALSNAAEIDHLRLPSPADDAGLSFMRDAVSRVAGSRGGDVCVAGIACGCCNVPALVLGIEGWLDTLLFDRERSLTLLETCADFSITWINSLFAAGASVVVLPVGFANPQVVSLSVAQDLTLPVLRRSVSRLDGPVLLHSAGAPMARYLDLFAGWDNIAGFVLNGGDSFSLARDKIGSVPALVGNVEGPTLGMRSVEDIEKDCMAVLRDRRDDPHFVLGTSMADIALSTDAEKIHLFRSCSERVAVRNDADVAAG